MQSAKAFLLDLKSRDYVFRPSQVINFNVRLYFI